MLLGVSDVVLPRLEAGRLIHHYGASTFPSIGTSLSVPVVAVEVFKVEGFQGVGECGF